MIILEYRVIARLRSNGDWIGLKCFPSVEEKTGKKIKRRFLWWTWEEDETIYRIRKKESVDFAKSLLEARPENMDYQDVEVIEKVYECGGCALTKIWKNGRWV